MNALLARARAGLPVTLLDKIAAETSIEELDGMRSVSGLPANYQLRGGDLIGWQYGSGPTRYALRRAELLKGGR